MSTSTDIAAPTKAPPPDEPKLEIDPSAVALDFATQHRRFWFARMPEEAVADDLKTPGVWRKVQQNRDTTMSRFDHIFAVAYDETWFAEATVSEATATGVTLAGIKIAGIERRQKPMMDDGTYRVEWRGSGFVVIRIKDGQPVSLPVQNEQVAERALTNMYPTRPG